MAKKYAGSQGLESVDAGELQREIHRRQRFAKSILVRRERLLARIAAIDDEMRVKGMRRAGSFSASPRARNSMTLTEAMRELLKGREMGIPEIVPGLAEVGYKSPSPNLRTMVNAQLLNKRMFKRISRGVYTAK